MPADDFEAWLQDELSALLPPASAPVPARRVSVLNARRWPRLLGWLLPPVSGKILLATTALAVAGTAGAAAATGRVTLPGGHHNRAVVSPSASVRDAAAPVAAGGAGTTGASGTSAGHPAGPGGSRSPGGQPPGPAPRPGAEAPETGPAAAGIAVGPPAPRESLEPRSSPEPSDSPHPSEPPQPRETPEPVQTSPRAAVPQPGASPSPGP